MTEKSSINKYYLNRKSSLMTQFDKFLTTKKDILIEKFSDSEVEELIMKMKNEYEILIPEIPYIGGSRNMSTIILIMGISILAIIRILEKRALTYREIGKIIYKLWESNFKKSDQNLGKELFNIDFIVKFYKNLAEKSEEKEYPYDWVQTFFEGDGEIFDYGLNIFECAIHKTFKKFAAEKYMPIMCLMDYVIPNLYGFGFMRTQTLGNGAPMCDNRYIRNGSTPRGWPPDHLKEYKME